MDLGQILLFAAGGIVFLVLIALTLRVADLRARLNALPKAEMDMVEMLGRIDADTVDPPGGTIVKDADGNPTGMLRETAQRKSKKPPRSLLVPARRDQKDAR